MPGRYRLKNLVIFYFYAVAHFNYNEIESYRYHKKSKEQIDDEFLSMLHVKEGMI